YPIPFQPMSMRSLRHVITHPDNARENLEWPKRSPLCPPACFRILRRCGYSRGMTDTALLVIDVQQSFEHRPYWSDRDLPAFRENLNALISACAAKRVPVLRILHVEDSGVFALASGHVKPMTWLHDTHDTE